jgi:protein O-mannosyl-transferase
MAQAEPSYGYSVLSRIMADSRHRVVITVNFDNLVADSLSIFSTSYPLVCGHESLAQFARTDLRRPLVLKVHRDLLMQPKSVPEELSNAAPQFQDVIIKLLEKYTPIVIGYGGNDGSLMASLESIPELKIPGGVFWCYREADGAPPPRIQAFVAKQRGKLVPIMGFDELMVSLGEVLALIRPDKLVTKRARQRAKELQRQEKELQHRLGKAASKPATPVTANATSSARSSVVEAEAVLVSLLKASGENSQGKPWWLWTREAESEPNIEKRDAIYRQGLTALPKSSNLMLEYGVFLSEVRKDLNAAQEMFVRAIEADPEDAGVLGCYATFLFEQRKDFDLAQAMFKRAIKADPKHSKILGNYAFFLWERQDFDAAQEMFVRAIQADPKDAVDLANYAQFLSQVRRDFDSAQEMFLRAIEAGPKQAELLCNFALFLWEMRKNFDGAQAIFLSAIAADPNNAHNLGNYAHLLLDFGQREAGLSQLNKAFALFEPDQAPVKSAESWMYAYCCGEQPSQIRVLTTLKALISQGVRTGNYDFSRIIAQAETSQHPEMQWIAKLAEVLGGRAGVDTLAGWNAWNNV